MRSGGFRGGCGGCNRTPLGVLQKNSWSTNFEKSEDSRQHDYYYYQFYLAASSHEIFLRVGGREGMKGLGHSKGTSCRTPLAKILDPPLLDMTRDEFTKILVVSRPKT